jgi:uncharacterized integral membrane protein
VSTDPSLTPPKGPARKRRLRENTRLISVGVLAVVATVFAVVNLDEVKVHLLVSTPRIPLIIVIAICILIGAAMGWVVGRRGR